MNYNYFPKVLEGNKDRNSNVKHVLYGVLTRYLRFLPQTHQGEVCMRTEVFGVKQTPSKFKNYCVMWSLHLLIYEQRFKPCGFVIWIGSFNNTNQSLSAWGKKPSHCDELLMLINSARMHQFLLYTLWWIVLLLGPVGFWAEDCKKIPTYHKLSLMILHKCMEFLMSHLHFFYSESWSEKLGIHSGQSPSSSSTVPHFMTPVCSIHLVIL